MEQRGPTNNPPMKLIGGLFFEGLGASGASPLPCSLPVACWGIGGLLGARAHQLHPLGL